MPRPPIDRRTLLRLTAVGVVSSLVPACGRHLRAETAAPIDPAALRRLHARGRLTARPGSPPAGPAPTGLQPLGLSGSDRDGAIFIPSRYRPDRPAPLLLALHGATGSGRRQLRHLQELAEARDIIVLAPDSRAVTWDVVSGRFGADVEFIDQALGLLFSRYAVDPTRIGAEGFSDGATYALSLGLINGDLFTRVVAFSPGFVIADRRTGAPPIFLSHGTADDVLPIDRCGRRIVSDERHRGYAVRFVEFAGGHTVPPEVARQAMDWFLTPA